MAKIYETKEDFERDKLKEQAQGLRLSAEKQSGLGMSLIGGSFLADLFHQQKPETRGWLRYTSFLLAFTGIIEAVRSWFTSSKAHNLELQSERLGPEQVV